ncbi:MAG TPA: hypothetical protein VEA37_13330, partial [Flavobacterium sp.]|nr:hypothetical protein [Flavobacterium sp.]
MKNLMTGLAIAGCTVLSLSSFAGTKAERDVPMEAKKRKLCEYTAAFVNYPSAMLGNKNSETEVNVTFSVENKRLNIMGVQCSDSHVKAYVAKRLT